MEAHVINLSDRPDRLEHMTRIMGQAGVPFERFPAVDQAQASRHPIAQSLKPLRSGLAWQPFEIGCLLSHYELWKRLTESDDRFAAIFEDDIFVSPTLTSVLNGAFPEDADIVKLETFTTVVYLSRRGVCSRGGGPTYHRLRSVHEGTAGYIINRRTAQILVDATPDFGAPVDHVLFSPKFARRNRLMVYQASPAVVIQGMNLPGEHRNAAMRSDRQPVEIARTGLLAQIKRLGRAPFRAARQLGGMRLVVPFSEA